MKSNEKELLNNNINEKNDECCCQCDCDENCDCGCQEGKECTCDHECHSHDTSCNCNE